MVKVNDRYEEFCDSMSSLIHESVYARILCSSFAKSATIAWVVNFAITFTINYVQSSEEIMFMHAKPAWGTNLLQNAFFCGLFTPIFSCRELKKLVREGRVAPIAEEELQGTMTHYGSEFACD